MNTTDKIEVDRRRFLKGLGILIAGIAGTGVALKICPLKIYPRKNTLLSINNMLRMGHCAPSVLETLLQKLEITDDLLIKSAGGLAGGIGGMGVECGGITAAVMQFGLSYGSENGVNGIPVCIEYVQDYTRRFIDYNASEKCAKIRAQGGMGPCIRAICSAPDLTGETVNEHLPMNGDRVTACALAIDHFRNEGFHCSHSVLSQLSDLLPVNDNLLRTSWPFIGGTAFQGLTCAAFSAGVIAIGAGIGGIENSYRRVFKMARRMMKNQDASDESINEFNRAINAGGVLGTWFKKEFGGLECRGLCKCDFSTPESVQLFIETNQIKECEKVAMSVTNKTRTIIAEIQTSSP